MTKEHPTLQEQVLARIEQGTVRMRPKLYFTIRAVAALSAAVTIFILSSLVISFILFSLDESGELFLLGFGTQGLVTFTQLFPWSLAVSDLLAILFLRYLLQEYKTVYRYSFLVVLATLLGASVAAAVIINLTPLHQDLHDRADTDELPFFGPLYRDIHTAKEDYGEFRGTVLSMLDRTLTIGHNDRDHDTDDGTRIVIVPDWFDMTTLQVGDEVYVAGEAHGDTITAYGIGELPPRRSRGPR